MAAVAGGGAALLLLPLTGSGDAGYAAIALAAAVPYLAAAGVVSGFPAGYLGPDAVHRAGAPPVRTVVAGMLAGARHAWARPPAAAGWPEDTVDLSAQCYDIFSGVVREIAANGRLRTGSADSAAQALWMCCHGVVALLAARPHFDWVDREQLIQVPLDGLLTGLVVD